VGQPRLDGDAAVPGWLATSSAWTWRLLLLLVASLALLWLLARLMVVSLPIIVALILATLCIPIAQWLEGRGLRPAAAAGIVVGGGLAAIVGILILIAPSFVEQLSDLGPTIREGWESLLTWIEDGPLSYDRERVQELLDSVQSDVSSSSGGLVSGVVSGAGIVAQLVAGLLLLVVLLFFFVKDREQLTGWILARTPARHREVVAAVGNRAWAAMSGYVRGTALIALIDALGIGIGLLVLGVPLVAPLTLLVFLGGFIPVIGAFTAGLVAVLVAFADGGVLTATLTLAVILAVQQVEGNALQPVIMRRAVSLHPVVILVALAAGAALAGIVGAFLSVPLAAVAAAVGNELRLRSEAQPASTA
jgi:predicted PurR-regulated permease PerM